MVEGVLAVLSPGQGSQKPGFLTPWLHHEPAAVPGGGGGRARETAAARLRWWSVLAGVDLVHLGTEAGADEIKDTARTQPLLVSAALLAAAELSLPETCVVAGHSVGELGAAALAGVLTPEAAVALAGVRGREMAAACAKEPTGMAALLGGDEPEVLAAIEAHGLFPANRNGAGQVVAAGAVDRLDKLVDAPPARTRAVPLQVAGAFHTPYMAPAQAALADVAAGITPADPTRILLSNLDGAAVASGAEQLSRLVRQVTAPVRWDACLRTLVDLGVTGVLELPPAGALAGLVKRELRGPGCPEVVTLNTPEDLPAARDLLARHGAAPSHEPSLQFRLVVADGAGTFEPVAGLAEEDPLDAGQVIGHVVTRQGPVAVTTLHAGTLTEWLAHHDDPVAPGQPLARIGGHS